jgi:superfamily I DNA/RNA helicase
MLLNADQQQVVDHDGHSLVVACPGSGKTRVITTKIGALLARHPGARICAVTFTRDASSELKRRAVSEVGEQVFNKQCRVGTFHSLSIKQLRLSNLLGKVASPAEQRAYLKRALALSSPDIPLDIATQMIEKAKTTFGDCPDKSTPLYEAYRGLLERNQVEDLYDVLRRAVELMRTKALPPMPVKFMLVDEFQDTDHVQLAWVMEHVKNGTMVTVVGDDDQSVYGWRGALGYAGMQDFLTQTDGTSITLAINYRCHEEILTAADNLISKNDARVEKRLFAARGKGGRLSSMRYPLRQDEADAAAEMIAKDAIASKKAESFLQSRTVPPGSWAVLSRNRFLLDFLEESLMANGIKYLRSAGESIWNRPPYIFMLGMFKSIQTGATDGVDQALNYALSIRVGQMGAHTTSKELHRQLGSDFYHILDGARLDLDKLEPESAEVIRAFSKRAVGWRNLAREGKFASVIRGVTDWFASFEEKDDRKAFICSIGEVACRLNGTLAQRANALAMPVTGGDAEEEPDGVRLLTMHSSKGLEFKNVWIVGCDVDTIPSPKSDNYEEERRLMYVAMTRAKDNLYFSSIICAEPSPFVLDAGCDPRQLAL